MTRMPPVDPTDILIRPVQQPVDRTVRLPGSKSLTNRALLAAALARGESTLHGILLADDTRLMIGALEALGLAVAVDPHGGDEHPWARVAGRGGYFPNTDASLYCGNAGTVIRFLTAACAAAQGDFRLDGSARMRQRPLGDLVSALIDLGASINYEQQAGFCPLHVHGRGLRGGPVTLHNPQSSQFVSAILLAAPRAVRDVLIEITGDLPSRPYVAMTLHVMEAFGVGVVAEQDRRFIVPEGQTYRACDYRIEPDASAASYFFAAAALTGGRVTVEGLGRSSLQGDTQFVCVLESMGCRIEQDEHQTTVFGPPAGDLRGVDVDLGDLPDTAPTLAVLAAFAAGPTRIRNVSNLRIKESDRLAALATELGRMNVATELRPDGIVIQPDGIPHAARITTYDDHRIAMSFALAGLRLDGMVIAEPGCVAKTFPGFFDAWAKL